jgi:hypothetical protein
MRPIRWSARPEGCSRAPNDRNFLLDRENINLFYRQNILHDIFIVLQNVDGQGPRPIDAFPGILIIKSIDALNLSNILPASLPRGSRRSPST